MWHLPFILRIFTEYAPILALLLSITYYNYSMLMCLSTCRKILPTRWGLHHDIKVGCECVLVAVKNEHLLFWWECEDSEVMKLMLKNVRFFYPWILFCWGFFGLVFLVFCCFFSKCQPVLFPVKDLNPCLKRWHYMEDPHITPNFFYLYSQYSSELFPCL